MAVVKITDDLIADVKRAAQATFDVRLDKAKVFPIAESVFAAEIYERGAGKHRTTLYDAPKGWYEEASGFTVICYGDLSIGQRFNFSGGWRRFPRNWGTDAAINQSMTVRLLQTGGANTYVSFIPDMQDAVENQWYQDIATWKHNRQQIETERATFVNGVGAVCKQFTTLSPALKAWPPLWDLLSQDVKERHKRIVTRTKVEVNIDKLNQTVDLGSLTATVVSHKLQR
jgi:hypothetical protein